jgi:K+-transporting ATPase c subunit
LGQESQLSALDLHISRRFPDGRQPRWPRRWGLDESDVQALIDQNIESWIGRRHVNVLMLNLALDKLAG